MLSWFMAASGCADLSPVQGPLPTPAGGWGTPLGISLLRDVLLWGHCLILTHVLLWACCLILMHVLLLGHFLIFTPFSWSRTRTGNAASDTCFLFWQKEVPRSQAWMGRGERRMAGDSRWVRHTG